MGFSAPTIANRPLAETAQGASCAKGRAADLFARLLPQTLTGRETARLEKSAST